MLMTAGRRLEQSDIVLKLPYEQAMFLQMLLDLLDRVLAPVELYAVSLRRPHFSQVLITYHARAQCSIRRCFLKHLCKMPRISRPTTRNNGDLDRALHIVDKLEIKAAIRAIFVNAIQQYFTRAHGLNCCNKLFDVEVATLAPAFDGALVPTVLLAVGSRR